MLQAEVILAYHKKNENHFNPTSPEKPQDFFTREFWQKKIWESRKAWQEETAFRFIFMQKDSDFESGPILGTINFTQVFRGPFQACFLGYGIDGERQGQGLTTEALKAAIQWLFKEKNLHRIMANHLLDNIASEKVLEKLGFQKEGLAKDYLFIDGQWRDHILTSLTNKDWKKA